MSNMTDYLENALLNHTLRNVPMSSPVGVYVGLFTSAVSAESGGVTEVSGGGYSRQQLVMGAPSGGVCSNSLTVFPVATASWGNVTHVGIFDALTGGNLLYHGQLDTPRNILTGDQFQIPAAQLTVTLL